MIMIITLGSCRSSGERGDSSTNAAKYTQPLIWALHIVYYTQHFTRYGTGGYCCYVMGVSCVYARGILKMQRDCGHLGSLIDRY